MDNLTTSSYLAMDVGINAHALGRYDVVTIGGQDFKQSGRDENTITLSRLDDVDIHETLTHEKFDELIKTGEVDFKRDHLRPSNSITRANNPYEALFNDLPRQEQRELLVIEKFVVDFDLLHRQGKSKLNEEDAAAALPNIHAAILASNLRSGAGEICARKEKLMFGAPKPGTLLKWRRVYLRSGRNIMALRDRRRGRNGARGTRMRDPDLIAFFERHVRAYADEREPSVAALYREMVADFKVRFKAVNEARVARGETPLVVPSKSTYERAIEKLDKFFVLAARRGEPEAKKTLRIVGTPSRAIRPAQRILIDHWRLNLQAIPVFASAWKKMPKALRDELKRVRLWICVAMCEATRVTMGFKLSTNATAASARATLHLTCVDKSNIALAAGCQSSWHQCASVETVANDGGGAMIELGFRGSVIDIGADHEIGQSGVPEKRAPLERHFRTIDQQSMHYFTGRTLENFVALGDYPAEQRASAFVDVLNKILVRYFVDIHMNSPHEGLFGQTPADAWKHGCRRYGVLPPPGPAKRRAIFGYECIRVITNRGLRFVGHHYKSKHLGRLLAEKGPQELLVRVDLLDIWKISYREMAPGTPWHTAKCEFDTMEGVSAEKWIGLASALKRKHATEASLRAPIVEAAILELRQIGNGAAALAELGPTTPSDEFIERAEKDLFKIFRIDRPSTRRRTMAAIESIEAQMQETVSVEPSPQPEIRPSRRRGRGSFSSKVLTDE
jgi:putative transposase